MATIDLHIHYMAPLIKEDAIAEAWVRRRGRTVVFLAAEVRTPAGGLIAHGELSYIAEM
jgi:acyl-coenzyme A thioesterase PaaI-like protein